MAMIHFNLTLYLIALFAVILTAIFLLAKYQKQFILQSRTKQSNLLAFVTKSFDRHTRLKQLGTEEATIERFNGKSQLLLEANLKNNKLESIQQSLVPALQYAMLGFLLWLSTLVKPAILHDDALVFILVTLMLFSCMRSLLKVPGILNKGDISLHKIEILLKQKTKTTASKLNEKLPEISQ